GRAAEAVRQVRADDPPGQNAAGAVSASQPFRPPGLRTANLARDFRPVGVHPLLGSVAEGELGGEAAYDAQSLPPGTRDDCPVVAASLPRAAGGATPDAESDALGPLCVLRDHGQRRSVVPLPGRGGSALEEAVAAPETERLPLLGSLQPLAGTLRAAG